MLRLVSVLLAGVFVSQVVFGNGDVRRDGLERTSTRISPQVPAEDSTVERISIAVAASPAAPETTANDPARVETLSLRAASSATELVVPATYSVSQPVAAQLTQAAEDGAVQIETETLPEPVTELAAVTEAVTEELAEEQAIWVVTANRVNVRQGPSTRYSVITKLSRGEEADVIEILDNGWAFIRTPEGQRGYLAAKFLDQTAQQG